jgi:hypothetical protein
VPTEARGCRSTVRRSIAWLVPQMATNFAETQLTQKRRELAEIERQEAEILQKNCDFRAK